MSYIESAAATVARVVTPNTLVAPESTTTRARHDLTVDAATRSGLHLARHVFVVVAASMISLTPVSSWWAQVCDLVDQANLDRLVDVTVSGSLAISGTRADDIRCDERSVGSAAAMRVIRGFRYN